VALTLIVIAAVWKQFGYNLAFYLAGLQAIPGSVLEAASVDGAGPVRRFFAITFPLLSPVTFFLFTLNMTFAFFETFGLIHAVTQGGPGDATSILVYRAWKDGFDGLQLGYSAAQSVILMLLVIALTAVQFGTPRRRSRTDGPEQRDHPRHSRRRGRRARVPALLRVRHQHAVPRRGHEPAAEARAVDPPGPELRRRVVAGGNGPAPPQQRDRRPRGRAREDRHLAPLCFRDRVL